MLSETLATGLEQYRIGAKVRTLRLNLERRRTAATGSVQGSFILVQRILELLVAQTFRTSDHQGGKDIRSGVFALQALGVTVPQSESQVDNFASSLLWQQRVFDTGSQFTAFGASFDILGSCLELLAFCYRFTSFVILD